MATWQVCIEDREDAILGAGILLDSEYILTCAHVAKPGLEDEPGSGLRVRFDGRDGIPPCDATVVPDGFTPEDTETGRGDVALLRLHKPVPGQPRILLRRQWRLGQRVRVFGYPSGLPRGKWAGGKVAGPAAAHSGLVQLDDRLTSPRVDRGFSGAAVIADETEEIVGMIKDREPDPHGRVCWMIPVDAIVESVPRLSRYVVGPSSDPGFSDGRDKPVTDTAQRALLRELAQWLGSGDGPDGICVVGGGPESAREALLSRLALPGERGWEATVPRGADVAIRAAGKSAEQVFRQLVAGFGGGTSAGADVAGLVADLGAPVAAIIDGVDASGELPLLLDTLVGVVNRSPRPVVRLLLGFRARIPDRVRGALVAELSGQQRRHGGPGVPGPGAPAPGSDADDRLTAATARLDELVAAEERSCRRHGEVTALITEVPPLLVAAGAALWVQLAVLRGTRGQVGGWWGAELAACETVLEDGLTRAKEVIAELDALVHRRNKLRGTLRLHRQLAVSHGFDEDRRLSRYYRVARDVLWRAPCDLRLAQTAVDNYYDEIMRRVGSR